MIGIVVSSEKATMHELQTIYGNEDLANFVEILAIDAYNRNLAANRADDN